VSQIDERTVFEVSNRIKSVSPNRTVVQADYVEELFQQFSELKEKLSSCKRVSNRSNFRCRTSAEIFNLLENQNSLKKLSQN
jgi:hypothetical protein